jgi:hypothetical protein
LAGEDGETAAALAHLHHHILRLLVVYSQHFIFFVTHNWAQ